MAVGSGIKSILEIKTVGNMGKIFHQIFAIDLLLQ